MRDLSSATLDQMLRELSRRGECAVAFRLGKHKAKMYHNCPTGAELEAILRILSELSVSPHILESFRRRYNTSLSRSAISRQVQREVWRRDNGRCVECGSNERLEYDHIIPVSKGGANTVRNIQLLCERCNRSKGNRI